MDTLKTNREAAGMGVRGVTIIWSGALLGAGRSWQVRACRSVKDGYSWHRPESLNGLCPLTPTVAVS